MKHEKCRHITDRLSFSQKDFVMQQKTELLEKITHLERERENEQQIGNYEEKMDSVVWTLLLQSINSENKTRGQNKEEESSIRLKKSRFIIITSFSG